MRLMRGNPKSDIRRPTQSRNPNARTQSRRFVLYSSSPVEQRAGGGSSERQCRSGAGDKSSARPVPPKLRYLSSDFEFRISFGFRTSDFGFCAASFLLLALHFLRRAFADFLAVLQFAADG